LITRDATVRDTWARSATSSRVGGRDEADDDMVASPFDLVPAILG
jgi:hypothetical protein